MTVLFLALIIAAAISPVKTAAALWREKKIPAAVGYFLLTAAASAALIVLLAADRMP